MIIFLLIQTVGDAVSDLLLVETVLLDKGWSIADWNAAYTDLPNRQLKVKVSVYKTCTATVPAYWFLILFRGLQVNTGKIT